MRGKALKKPARSIQYLLSADRRLRRLSMRRIPARLRRARKQRSIRSEEPQRPTAFVRPPSLNVATIALAVVGIIAAAGIAARQSVNRSNLAATASLVTGSAQSEKTPSPPKVDTKKITISDTPTARSAINPTAADASAAKRPARESANKSASPIGRSPKTDSPATAGASLVSVPSEDTTSATTRAEATPVTLSGCLQVTDGTFWLKDTQGEAAPKSRSWKSGFLKRRSSPVELVDAADALKLSSHVSQRISVTGLLLDTQMRARSLQTVAASCG